MESYGYELWFLWSLVVTFPHHEFGNPLPTQWIDDVDDHPRKGALAIHQALAQDGTGEGCFQASGCFQINGRIGPWRCYALLCVAMRCWLMVGDLMPHVIDWSAHRSSWCSYVVDVVVVVVAVVFPSCIFICCIYNINYLTLHSS